MEAGLAPSPSKLPPAMYPSIIRLLGPPQPQGRFLDPPACLSVVSWWGCSSSHRCQAGRACLRHRENGSRNKRPGAFAGRLMITLPAEPRSHPAPGDEDEWAQRVPSPVGAPSSSPALGARTFCCPSARSKTAPPQCFWEESRGFGD